MNMDPQPWFIAPNLLLTFRENVRDKTPGFCKTSMQGSNFTAEVWTDLDFSHVNLVLLRNRNRNRRKLGTVTFCVSRTGTGIRNKLTFWIKGYHKSSHRRSVKLCIWFPSVNKFLGSSAASININRQYFLQNVFKKLCFLWSRKGAGTGTGTGTGNVNCKKLEPEP